MERIFSITSCSVFEVDDEHEAVSATRTDLRGKQGKSPIESFHGLRINFIVSSVLLTHNYRTLLNFQESLLHGKILPCGILDGFTVKLGASGLFLSKQVVLPVTTFWFNVSEHQAASPYLVGLRILFLSIMRICFSRVLSIYNRYQNVVIKRPLKER